MTVEVLPIGTRCSLSCQMCYQQNIREAGNQSNGQYDMEAMKRALEKENYHFSVFGGEPLLMPIDDLEELWRFGLERFGQNSVQTSATCVEERHYELFAKYKVSVGMSLEGPGELNDIRWAGSLERTREATARAEAVLYRLLQEKRPVGVITTLNRGNASPERLPQLLEWFRELDGRGLSNVNLHLMEIENQKVRERWALSDEENADALLACADLQAELKRLRFQPITDMTQLLLGRDQWEGGGVSCNWNACDPYSTRAVLGVNGQGERVNCSRTNKAGVDMLKAGKDLPVRSLALNRVPMESGGCGGCRFWFACKGSCPGESVSGDWRRKTEHCGTLMETFARLERRLSSVGFRPVSRDSKKLRTIERNLLAAFREGRTISVKNALESKSSARSGEQGNRPHGDVPHGDHEDAVNPVVEHGDHTDVR